MTTFIHLTEHITEYGQTLPDGKLVLSTLGRGDSPLKSSAPSLKLVLDGEERYHIGKRSYVVRPGQFMLVDGGTEMRASLRSGATGMCVYLPLSKHAAAGADGFAPIILAASGCELGQKLVSNAKHLADPNTAPAMARQLMRQVTSEFEATLQRAINKLDRSDAVRDTTRRDRLFKLEIARAYLHDNPEQRISLEELARHVGMSPFHLSRCFSDAYGSSPVSYHRDLRLLSAAERLGRGELTPTEAADLFGFNDLPSFGRAFRNKFGVPPSRAGEVNPASSCWRKVAD